jgi:hypothetical protein
VNEGKRNIMVIFHASSILRMAEVLDKNHEWLSRFFFVFAPYSFVAVLKGSAPT